MKSSPVSKRRRKRTPTKERKRETIEKKMKFTVEGCYGDSRESRKRLSAGLKEVENQGMKKRSEFNHENCCVILHTYYLLPPTSTKNDISVSIRFLPSFFWREICQHTNGFCSLQAQTLPYVVQVTENTPSTSEISEKEEA